MQQIIHPDAYSRYFAYISWPHPSSCGPDWIISAPRLFDPVQGLVVRQYQVGSAAYKETVFQVYSHRLYLFNLFHQGDRIDHHTIAYDTRSEERRVGKARGARSARDCE